MYLAPSETRKQATGAISSGVPIRFKGTFCSSLFTKTGFWYLKIPLAERLFDQF